MENTQIKESKLSEISFKELSNFNDSNSLVCIGLLIKENQISEFEEFLQKDLKLIPEDKHVIKMHFITGNKRGDARKGADSRSDYLIEFDHPEIPINIMARLMYGQDFKWTSDFIDNFRRDYFYN